MPFKQITKEQAVKQLLDMPPVGWQAEIDTHDDLDTLDRELTSQCAHAMTLLGYIRGRTRPGGHERAVKDMNRFRTAARKLLAYSYPKDDLRI